MTSVAVTLFKDATFIVVIVQNPTANIGFVLLGHGFL